MEDNEIEEVVHKCWLLEAVMYKLGFDMMKLKLHTSNGSSRNASVILSKGSRSYVLKRCGEDGNGHSFRIDSEALQSFACRDFEYWRPFYIPSEISIANSFAAFLDLLCTEFKHGFIWRNETYTAGYIEKMIVELELNETYEEFENERRMCTKIRSALASKNIWKSCGIRANVCSI